MSRVRARITSSDPKTVQIFARYTKAGPYLIWLLLFGILIAVAAENFILFHGLAEIFSIVIACGIFMFAWASRQFLPNHYLLFIGIAYLFVGGIDLLHTLAYKGVGILPGYQADEATQLWIAARYLESLSLLLAPVFLKRRFTPGLAFASYGFLFVVIVGSIFFWDFFPSCYIDGSGLTPFKIISEYLISCLLIAALVHLLHHRREFEKDVLLLLAFSIGLTTAAELAFTTYASVYGWTNFVGHLLKIFSFFLIYRAIIVTGLVRPYALLFRDLKQSQQELRREKKFAESLINLAQAVILVLDQEGKILHYNPYLEKLTGRGLAHMRGRDWFAHFTSSQDQARLRNHFFRMLASGEVANYIWPIEDLSGLEHQIEWYNRPLTDEQGGIIGLLCIGHNVSERQAIEKEREQLIIDLQAALQKVKTLSGLLPICASCKKIRDDRGYWNQIEVYIQERSEADFSHGICPDCARQLYPEIYDRLPPNSTAG